MKKAQAHSIVGLGLILGLHLANVVQADQGPGPGIAPQGTSAASMFTATVLPGELERGDNSQQYEARQALQREVLRRQSREIRSQATNLGNAAINIHH